MAEAFERWRDHSRPCEHGVTSGECPGGAKVTRGDLIAALNVDYEAAEEALSRTYAANDRSHVVRFVIEVALGIEEEFREAAVK